MTHCVKIYPSYTDLASLPMESNENKDPNMKNRFLQIINQCFKFTLLYHLIDPKTLWSNQSYDILSLRGSCKSIRVITEQSFLENAILGLESLPLQIDKSKFKWVEHIQLNALCSFDDILLFKNLYEIIFSDDFDQPLPNSLSECYSLRCLSFGDSFNQPLGKNSLPPNLTELTFGDSFDQLIADSLPSSILELTFGDSFDQKITGLPPRLMELWFGDQFNQQITESLPDTLHTLIFGDFFNQSLTIALPRSLRCLVFGMSYNKPLAQGILPDSLQRLEFGQSFNHPLNNNILPQSTETLRFGNNYDQSLTKESFPGSLKNLILGESFFSPSAPQIKLSDLPKSIQEITFGSQYNFLHRVKLSWNQKISVKLLFNSYDPEQKQKQKNQVITWKVRMMFLLKSYDNVIKGKIRTLELTDRLSIQEHIQDITHLIKDKIKSLKLTDRFSIQEYGLIDWIKGKIKSLKSTESTIYQNVVVDEENQIVVDDLEIID